MIRPTNFMLNDETCVSNSFQVGIDGLCSEEVNQLAQKEFDNYVHLLKQNNIEVIVFDDLNPSKSPDSIFPNNWLSTHEEGFLITYPMEAKNRRLERREDIIDYLIQTFGYKQLIKLETYESRAQYLEGTGSVIFDKDNRLAYMAVSPRSHLNLFEELCQLLGFKPIHFKAFGPAEELIYHTNVLLFVGKTYVGVCLDIIDDNDRQKVIEAITNSGKTIIKFTKEQAHNCFAGNMIQVINNDHKTVLLLSKKAHDALSSEQLTLLQQHNDVLLPISIPTIEAYGGGSVRCMVAEIFHQ